MKRTQQFGFCVSYIRDFFDLLFNYKQDILNSYDDKLFNIIINTNKIISVKKYFKFELNEGQRDQVREILWKVETNKQHTKLKKMLNMDAPFCKILDDITNKQNMNNQINTFYENLFGKGFYKLITILNHGTNEELETISEILKNKEVQDYFINWASKDQSNAMKEDFKDGIEGTMIGNNESKTKYQRYLFHHLFSVIKKVKNIQEFIMCLMTISDNYQNDSKKSVVEYIVDITLKAVEKYGDDFKEILDNHNLRNILKEQHKNEEYKYGTIFNMKKDIENDIINKKPIEISTKKFYDFLFGHDFDDFKTILLKGTLEELKLILGILNKEQVKDYISASETDVHNSQLVTEYDKCSNLLTTIVDINNKILGNIENKKIEDITNETTKLQTSILKIIKECFEIRKENIEKHWFNK